MLGLGAVGTVIGEFVPLSPVVAFLIAIAARVDAPAQLILTRPSRNSGERTGMAANSLNPFQTSSKKVSSGCVPDAKTDRR